MPRRPMPWWVIAAIAFALVNMVAAGIALFLLSRGPAPVADIPLTDQNGHPAKWSDYRGKHVIVYFGYTGCPDACPTGLTDLSHALKSLGPDAAQVQVLFVSLDPAADTPAQLSRYLPYFNSSFIGLVPTPDRLRDVAKEFGVTFEKTPSKAGKGYRIDHSTACYILSPRGTMEGFFLTPVATESLRRQLGLAS